MHMKAKALLTVFAVMLLSGLLAPASSARAAWDTTPVKTTRHVSPTPRVVDLRVGQHPTYDRVVVDFTGPIPGYRVAYVDALRYDPSGGAVPLPGARFIQLTLTPATGHDAQGNSVYRGPNLVRYSMPTLRGAALTGDFEGVVSFGLALSHLDTFRVFELHGPNRLVIDIHH